MCFTHLLVTCWLLPVEYSRIYDILFLDDAVNACLVTTVATGSPTPRTVCDYP